MHACSMYFEVSYQEKKRKKKVFPDVLGGARFLDTVRYTVIVNTRSKNTCYMQLNETACKTERRAQQQKQQLW